MELNNTSALITGASGGIGEALAYALAEEGAKLVLFARRDSELSRVAGAIGRDRCAIVAGDVRSLVDLERAVQVAVDRFGGLDILVNNAGVAVMAKLSTVSPELFHQGFDINVLGPILGLQAALPALEARGGGMIVNISSAMSLRPGATMAIYSATKAALNVLSASMRIELKDKNIQVMTVHPGYIANDFAKNTLRAEDVEAYAQRLQTMPSGRTSADAARDIVGAMKTDQEVFRSLPDMPLTVPL